MGAALRQLVGFVRVSRPRPWAAHRGQLAAQQVELLAETVELIDLTGLASHAVLWVNLTASAVGASDARGQQHHGEVVLRQQAAAPLAERHAAGLNSTMATRIFYHRVPGRTRSRLHRLLPGSATGALPRKLVPPLAGVPVPARAQRDHRRAVLGETEEVRGV